MLCVFAPALSLILLGTPVEGRCGVERQAVKTLTDAAAKRVHLEPRASTVEELIQLKPPRRLSDAREAAELSAYSVSALLVGFKLETGDQDFHLVLQGSSGATLIAEIPAPECSSGSVVLEQIAAARSSFVAQFGAPLRGVFRRLKKPIAVQVVGVGFFDPIHGQRGVAPNGFELHPVLRLSVAPEPR
jgi:hypothetical protein